MGINRFFLIVDTETIRKEGKVPVQRRQHGRTNETFNTPTQPSKKEMTAFTQFVLSNYDIIFLLCPVRATLQMRSQVQQTR